MTDRQNRQVENITDHTAEMTFWEHLDVFRGVILRIAVLIVVSSILAFCFKEQLFAVILAPKEDSFFIYRLLNCLAIYWGGPSDGGFTVKLINTGLAEQFKMHVKASLYAGGLIASPYVIYLIFRFVSPALYENERKATLRAVIVGYAMFILGVILCYCLIFPLTFRFLGTYQVSSQVENLISLQSYMDTLLVMSFLIGVLFELPVLCWVLGRLGLLSSDFMRRYRKHAIVVILVIAAVITPTSDVFTLCLVALPICLLYEVSIWVVKASRKNM